MTDVAPDASNPSARPLRMLGSWTLGAAIVVLSLAMQAMGHLNGDDSWFILFAERVFDGARAYVDISDPNPPAGFLVYLPAVFFGRLAGVSAETATVLEILVCTALSLALCGAILTRANMIDADERGLWRNAALWLTLFVVGFGYAEREHFALLAAAPFIAAAMARAGGRSIAIPLALLAGLGGGVALSFKPYFALGLGGAMLAGAFVRRSARPLFTLEAFAAGGVALAYLAFVYLRYPDYIARVLPLAVEVYAPARNLMSLVVVSPPFLFNLALLGALAFGLRTLGVDARAVVLGAASAGFFATYVIQAKIWFNHAYPGIALGVMALAALALGLRGKAPEGAARFARLCLLPALVCAPFLSAVLMNLPGVEENPGLAKAVREIGPAHPKIATLAEQLDVGHPLTRRLGGVWIGVQNAMWVNNCVRQILGTQKVDEPTRTKLLGYVAAERRELAADIARGKPDILLVESATLREWAQTKPEFVNLFDGLERRGQAGEIEIWARR